MSHRCGSVATPVSKYRCYIGVIALLHRCNTDPTPIQHPCLSLSLSLKPHTIVHILGSHALAGAVMTVPANRNARTSATHTRQQASRTVAPDGAPAGRGVVRLCHIASVGTGRRQARCHEWLHTSHSMSCPPCSHPQHATSRSISASIRGAPVYEHQPREM